MINEYLDPRELKATYRLLNRSAPEGYLEEWSRILKEGKKEEEMTERTGFIIFQFGQEFFGIAVSAFVGVFRNRVIRKMPHYSASTLLGMVNIRGQLTPCLALHEIVDVNMEATAADFNHLITIEAKGFVFAFPATRIYEMHRCRMQEIEDVPRTVAKSRASFLLGLLNWQGQKAALLDTDLLFHEIKTNILP
ncbi:MAG: chemotaxis protein CheW [Waddliaceae bacterium]